MSAIQEAFKKIGKSRTVICPYCEKKAALVDSACVYHGRSYGMIWICAPCDAYVGVHKNNDDCVPLGRLANAELRSAKIRAHAAFDPLWRNGEMKRGQAYAWMEQALNLPRGMAHIGEFDVDLCEQLINAVEAKRGAK